MRKIFLVCLGSLVCGASVAAAYGSGGKHPPQVQRYRVTVVNLTKGQPLTPPVVVIHREQAKLVGLGHPASSGLAELAQDGATAMLVDELKARNDVLVVATGDGVIMPGEKAEIIIERRQRDRIDFSVFSMLARTNDAFIKARANYTGVYLAKVYDAGVEQNTEDCAHIPAPPCGNHNVGTGGGEGFVRPHEGLHLGRDLNGLRDTFASVAAKIIVQKL